MKNVALAITGACWNGKEILEFELELSMIRWMGRSGAYVGHFAPGAILVLAPLAA